MRTSGNVSLIRRLGSVLPGHGRKRTCRCMRGIRVGTGKGYQERARMGEGGWRGVQEKETKDVPSGAIPVDHEIYEAFQYVGREVRGWRLCVDVLGSGSACGGGGG
ncbi:hypothetical protein FRC18_007895 [Serendipita sp. 400]|nr:hypothetical protein FRC18_007895 [Serendipita sp. 400]